MARKAIIHIGSSKTGSSSIQYALFNMRSHDNIHYPKIEGKGHQNISIMFQDRERLTRGLKYKFKSNIKSYKKYKKYFTNSFKESIQKKNIIISSEFLFTFTQKEISDFHRFLKDVGKLEEFKIIAYIREPASYYLSFVQQQLKGSSEFTLPHEFKCGYKRAIENWKAVFGENVVEVREFSKDKLVGENVVKDFAKVCSNFLGETLKLDYNSFQNESLTAEGICLVEKYRQIYLGSASENGNFSEGSNKLINFLKKSNIENKPKLKQWVIDLVNSNTKEDIKYLKEKFGILKYVNTIDECDLGRGNINSVYDILDNVSEDSIQLLIERVIETYPDEYERLKDD